VTEPDRLRIIAPAPLFYLPAFVLVTGLHWLWPLPIVDHPATPWIGRAILFPGLALHLWGVWSMKRNRTPINPYHPPTTVVSSGAFRVSRNPLYVGLNLVLLGLVLILNSVAGLVVILTLFAVVHFAVILPEERYLEGKFGDRYSHYQRMVRRYL
jgi:protein-S-isoprenylcysteine O-methyltransferase Ste14